MERKDTLVKSVIVFCKVINISLWIERSQYRAYKVRWLMPSKVVLTRQWQMPASLTKILIFKKSLWFRP